MQTCSDVTTAYLIEILHTTWMGCYDRAHDTIGLKLRMIKMLRLTFSAQQLLLSTTKMNR